MIVFSKVYAAFVITLTLKAVVCFGCGIIFDKDELTILGGKIMALSLTVTAIGFLVYALAYILR